MIKHLFSLLILTGVITSIKAQQVNPSNLHLYASFGVKQAPIQSFFYNKDVTPAVASTIGAGSLFQKRKLLAGFHFSYAKASKKTAEYNTDYAGFSSGFDLGYAMNLSPSWKLNFLTGFGYNLGHVYITNSLHADPQLFNSAIFHHRSYTVPAAVMIQNLKANGVFWGVKAGYNMNVQGKDEWEFHEGSKHHRFSSQPAGFFVQLNLGGALKLK